MDVERTIQSILESQLRAEVRADRADKRMDRFDKQLHVTGDLVRAGIKMVREMRVEAREARKETDFKLNALMDSQARTDEQVRKHDESLKKHEEAMRKSDEKFNRLLERLGRRYPNGRN